MSDEEVLSQVLMLGFAGREPPESLLRWVETRGLGGVKIFGWNAEDTEALAEAVAKLQKSALDRPASVPLLVATDQEGGWIRHVKGKTSESPGNMAIGATASARDAYLAGFYIGKELRILGITMNFAPDIDIATNPESAIIGPRAFSDDPALVAKLGLAWARGSLAAGVIPTAKHYPGHGATPLDSHGALPIIDIDGETFLARELSPFAHLARNGVPAIMSGHLAFPRVAGNEAASLSKTMIQGYLRGKLGYEGLVITDDLYMTGALGDEGILETSIKALSAGNDMILLSATPEREGGLWRGLLARYREDESFRERVREGAGRVMALKLKHLRPIGREGLAPEPAAVSALLPDSGAPAFFADLARRSVSLVGTGGKLPFLPSGKVMIAGPFDTFVAMGRKKYANSSSYLFSYRPEKEASKAELDDFRASLEGCGAAIVCVANRAGMQFATAAHDAGLKVAIVSVLSPAHAAHSSWASAIVAVYHYAPICLEAGFDALLGAIPAKGRVPLAPGALR